MATPTLHQFTQLPPEIRNIIWELSLKDLKPQIVYAYRLDERSKFHWGHYCFRYTVPPLLQACRESRAWAQTVYTKTLSCRRRGPGRRLDRSHVWFNFDSDMVEIQCSDITSRVPQARRIKHLRIVAVEVKRPQQFTRNEIYDRFWSHLKLAQFIRLEKLHIFTNLDVIGCEHQVQTFLKRGLTCGIRIMSAFTGKSRDPQNYRQIAWEEDWHFFSNNRTNFLALAHDTNATPVIADEPIELPKAKDGRDSEKE